MRSIVELYKQWTTTTMLNKQPASGRTRVVILYDTIYGATERMAEEIARGVRDADRIPVVLKASLETVTRTADELFSAGAIALGSPTLNNGCMPTLAVHKTFIKGLGFKGRRGMVFGSYGWNAMGQKALSEFMKDVGVEEACPPVSTMFSPDDESLKKML